jgi:hypothetical protein
VDAWGWLAVALPFLVLACAAWALRSQRRKYPADRPRLGEPDERPRGLRWIGFIYGGGRG